MELDKQKKSWNSWDNWLLYVVCLVIMPANILLPLLRVEWIVGWPAFIGRLLALGPLMLFLLLVSILKQPLSGKFAKAKKRIWVILLAVVCAAQIGVCTWLSFFSNYLKVDRYERSPHGNNRAVVLVDKEEFWGSERIYPVRAWLFYKSDKEVYIRPDSEAAFNWISNTTLEIIHTDKDSGEVSVEYLYW